MKKDTDSDRNMLVLRKLDLFFLAVGEEDDYKKFAVRILEELKKLVFYEQAVALFLNTAGKVTDCYLMDVSENWGYAYREYYSKMQSRFHLGMKKDRKRKNTKLVLRPIVWADLPENEFIKDCIESRGVQHSMEVILYDNRGNSRLVLALDRTKSQAYSESEVSLLNRIVPHLDNIHRKFFLASDPDMKIIRRKDALLEIGALTGREKEVVSCLCEGISPSDISSVLNISCATTYKHIANIYKKLNVNNLQELLVYFLTDYKEFSPGNREKN